MEKEAVLIGADMPASAWASPGAQRVLQAAIKAFAQRGYDSASVRYIAGEARVDPALIVHAFGSKEQLWRTCVDEVAHDFIAALTQGANRADGSSQSTIDALVDTVCEKPEAVQFILAEIVRQDERFDYVYTRLVAPLHQILRSSIEPDGRLDAREEIRLLAWSGAIATTIVSRQFMVGKGLLSPDMDMFRTELRYCLVSINVR